MPADRGSDGPFGGDANSPFTVRLLDADPGLAAAVPAPQRPAAARAAVMARECLPRGGWSPEPPVPLRAPALGRLVLSGLLLRRTTAGARSALEVLGAGDFLPDDGDRDALPGDATVSWLVLDDAQTAILDVRFVQLAARFPALAAELLRRTERRLRTVGFLNLVHAHPLVQTRLRLVLELLALRWGRVTGDGLLLSLPLTHEMIAELVASGRPTVTMSLLALERRGEISRTERGLLLPRPGGRLDPS